MKKTHSVLLRTSLGVALAAIAILSCDSGGSGETSAVAPPSNQGDAAARVSETALAAQFLRIKTASGRFRSMQGRYPTSVSELVDEGLIHPGQELDPWGNPFVLQVDGAELTVLSYGADGKPGGVEHNADRSTR